MNWINGGTDRATTLASVPELAGTFKALYESFWTQPHIPGMTLELCRLRLAQLHNSDLEWARKDCEIGAGKREQLAGWSSCDGFTHAERACIEFTEIYAMDAQAITDDIAAAVKGHYGDAGLVALVEALGIFDGMTRLSLLWQLSAPDVAKNGGQGE
ncbi:hypothetical protein FV139_13145 [Parahaliea maris]|uniref:Carboxymuconolactone decarboxylase family protein n=1 Tax=Parahaliea maris TaxID=2716870 RepID=A0A5C8ZWH5_9GAMM|nr:hypothetical protein [Parahaliea maris]TXS92903.1 hypothetical protein FV139_13145 [Parahaliea maris]